MRTRMMLTLIVTAVMVVGMTTADLTFLTNSAKAILSEIAPVTPADALAALKECVDDAGKQHQEHEAKGCVIHNESAAFFHRRHNRIPTFFEKYTSAGSCIRKNIATFAKDALQRVVNGLDLRGTSKEGSCLKTPVCNLKATYRTVDGSCNNLDFPHWGQAGIIFDRFLPPTYDDMLTSSPRSKSKDGSPLPSARSVSSKIVSNTNVFEKYTTLFTHFGQFVDHDITFTPTSNVGTVSCCQCPESPNCFPIEICDKQEDFFAKNCNQTCLEFVRSDEGFTFRTGLCSFGSREQYSAITAFIDASQVYGSDATTAAGLRTNKTGKLRTTKCSEQHGTFLPTKTGTCQANSALQFMAGDTRVNEVPLLTVMQTLMMREHNKICDELFKLNPLWTDEKIYQEARRIVGAEMQNMVYTEYLPVLLGPGVMAQFGLTALTEGYFEGYNKTVQATMWTEFSTAAYRFGHSLIANDLDFAKGCKKGSKSESLAAKPTPLGDTFNNPEVIVNKKESFEEATQAMAMQRCERFDNFLSQSVTHNLFKAPGAGLCGGTDLASLNIQRGRDHGLGSYTQLWNLFFPDKKITSFADLKAIFREGVEVAELEKVYKCVEDIDLWLGIISENPVPGSLVGPTGSTIIALQFGRTKVGDRFYYENGAPHSPNPFTIAQLDAIRKFGKLSRILCDNGQARVSSTPFVASDEEGDCKNAPLDLTAWREEGGAAKGILPSPPSAAAGY